MSNVLPILISVAMIFGLCVILALWQHHGWGRSVVWVLYAIANRMLALAAAADHARLVYHERLAPGAAEEPTPEPVVRAARVGKLQDREVIGR